MRCFGNMLEALRLEKGLSQADLAKEIYVSSGTISNYENGVHYPDIEKLIALADYFHVSVDYLLGRSTNRLSTEVFNQIFCYKETIGSFVDKIKALTEERKLALSLIVRDMEASTQLQQTEKDELA